MFVLFIVVFLGQFEWWESIKVYKELHLYLEISLQHHVCVSNVRSWKIFPSKSMLSYWSNFSLLRELCQEIFLVKMVNFTEKTVKCPWPWNH